MLFRIFLLIACPTFAAAGSHPCHTIDPSDKPARSVAACTELLSSEALIPSERNHALENRGIALRELGKFDESVADLSLSFASSGDPFTMRMLAWTYRQMGRYAKAEQLYTLSLKDEDHVQGWLSRCVVRQDMDRFEQALEDCRQALLRDKDNLDVLYFTARAFSFLEQPRKALPLTQRGMSLAPHEPRHLTEHVWALHQMGRSAEARKKAHNGLDRFPGEAGLLSFLEDAR